MQQQRTQLPPNMMQQVPQQMYGQQPAMQMNPQMMQQQPQFMQGNQIFSDQLQNLTQQRSQGLSKEDKNKFPSLYVGNLPKENFFDLDFYKLFTSKGYRLKSAKVVLHKRTSKPLGYGYLQFATQEEAERALQGMNNYVLNGQALRISLSMPKFEYNEKANLLVKNLDKDVSQQELYEQFRLFGEILSCKLETYQDGQSKGYAFIQFQNEAEAEKALEAMNEKELKGKKIEINKHEKKTQREIQNPAKFNNLFVKNLPKGTDDAQLKNLFQEFGQIDSASVQRDEQGNHKDYGYVCYKDPDHAEKAMQAMNKKQISDDHFLIVNQHVSKKDNEPSHGSKINPITQNLTKTFNSNVFVKFIPNDVTEEQLRQTFTIKDSKIVSIKLVKYIKKYDNEESSPYQFAYILYDTVPAAQKAIQTFHLSTVFGHKPLLVELWVSKEEKEQENKKKENQKIKQFLNNMLNLTIPQYQQVNQQQNIGGGYPQSQGPQGQQMMPNQYNNRGGAGNMNRGNRGGRGGPQRGGHRGGMGPGHNQQYTQRQHPPQQMPPNAFPQQYNPMYMQQMPQQQFGMMQPVPNPVMGMPQQQPNIPPLPLPEVDLSQLAQISDPNEKRQFVGNALYPQIEAAFGQQFAGKITGMLIDENVVDFNQLLSNPSYFSHKAFEAFNLLQQAQNQPLVQANIVPQ